jgi:hypothetical protein
MNDQLPQKWEEQEAQFIPTVKDLEEVFPKLPDPKDWPYNYIEVKVAVRVERRKELPLFGTGGQTISTVDYQSTHRTSMSVKFFKLIENGKDTIWIYHGMVRKEDAKTSGPIHF